MNSDECLMTRMQEMSLDYHFTVEQEAGSSTYAFFGFNGDRASLYNKLFCQYRLDPLCMVDKIYVLALSKWLLKFG